MNKYQRCMSELETKGITSMKVFGNSMVPIIKSGSVLTFKKCEAYEPDDVVFCKVKGRYIDAHKIVAVSPERGYLIANNHGHNNGWTHTIYGKVIEINV